MPLTAFFLIILAAFFHAFWNFAAKKVSGDLAVIWIGMAAACLAMVPFLAFLNTEDFSLSAAYPYLIFSGIIHTVYYSALAQAYEHGEISVVYPIGRGSGIVITALVAVLLLGEKISLAGALGIGVVCAGILLLGLRNSHQKRGILFALLMGIGMAGYSLADASAVKVSHPFLYIFACTTLFTSLLFPYIWFYKKDQLRNAWKTKKKYSLIMGFGSVGTYLIILFVFRMAQVSYVVAARELAVAIGAVLGFVFLKERASARKVIGILGIVAGMILIKLA